MVPYAYGNIKGRLGQAGTDWDKLEQGWSEGGTLGQRAGLIGTYFGLFSLFKTRSKIHHVPMIIPVISR